MRSFKNFASFFVLGTIHPERVIASDSEAISTQDIPTMHGSEIATLSLAMTTFYFPFAHPHIHHPHINVFTAKIPCFTDNFLPLTYFTLAGRHFGSSFTSANKMNTKTDTEMNAYSNSYAALTGMTMDEYSFVHHASAGLTANQTNTFMAVYSSRRKNPTDILVATLFGFFGLAGVQRFMTGHIILGILYLVTGGFLGIGTVIDLFSYKNLANDYNRHLAYDCYHIAKMNS